MRVIGVLCAAFALGLLTGCGNAPSYSAEQMARKTFDALKAHDRDAFLSLGATLDDLEDLFEAMRFKNEKEEKYMLERRAKIGGARGMHSMISDALRASFDDAREASGKQLSWKDAEFGGFEVEREQVRWTVRTEDIRFTAKTPDGSTHRFKLDDCVVLGERRFLTEPMKYYPPRK